MEDEAPKEKLDEIKERLKMWHDISGVVCVSVRPVAKVFFGLTDKDTYNEEKSKLDKTRYALDKLLAEGFFKTSYGDGIAIWCLKPIIPEVPPKVKTEETL